MLLVHPCVMPSLPLPTEPRTILLPECEVLVISDHLNLRRVSASGPCILGYERRVPVKCTGDLNLRRVSASGPCVLGYERRVPVKCTGDPAEV